MKYIRNFVHLVAVAVAELSNLLGTVLIMGKLVLSVAKPRQTRCHAFEFYFEYIQ